MNPNDDSLATRATLLERLRDRDDQASWQEFFDTYWRLIYRVAIKAGLTEAEAQDVVQETVLSVANHVGEFHYDPRVCSFKTWMLRLTRWRILDLLRRRDREEAALGRRIHRTPGPNSGKGTGDERADCTGTLDSLPDPEGMELERIWEEEWEEATLSLALNSLRARLPARDFQVFHLYAVKQLPAGQVARMVGVNVARVYLTKHRVAARLKQEIRRLEAGTGISGQNVKWPPAPPQI